MPYKVLFDEDILRIKKMIWNGETQRAISESYKVSEVHINRIANGRQGYHIAWPDGNVGAISNEQKGTIRLNRRKGITTEQAVAHVGLDPNRAELHKRIEQAHAEVLEREAADGDKALRDLFTNTGYNKSYDGNAASVKKAQPVLNPLPWDTVLERYGTNPLVSCTGSEDYIRQMAIGHLAREFDDEDYWSEGILEGLLSIAATIISGKEGYID
jgi:hypothetical protein